jgi:hypothetical protein
MGGLGLYFDRAPGSLANIIDMLDADSAEAARLGILARTRADQFYRWDAVAAAYASLFTTVAEARRAGRAFVHQDVYHPEDFVDADAAADPRPIAALPG